MHSLLFTCALALAEDPAPPPVDLSEALLLEPVNAADLRFFAPRRWRLPANARAQTDFTAYTLEFGEVRLGLAGISAGVLPRTQVGTVPVLDALGVFNVQLKVTPLRVGPLDVAGSAKVYRYAGDTMGAAYVSLGGTASLMVLPAWSVHGGAEWSSFAAKGTPDLDPLLPVLGRFTAFTPSEEMVDQAEEALFFEATGRAVTVRAATDVRFNRRDSVILQGQAMVWGQADLPVEVPAAVTGGAPLQEGEGAVPVTDAYSASIAYQLALKHLELRVGVGTSSVPGAWLLQSTELAWRFGGPTRSEERRMVRGWRQNKRALRQEAQASAEGVAEG